MDYQHHNKASRDLINTFKKFFISHIYHKANDPPDWEANVAVNHNKIVTWQGEEGLLDDIRSII